MVCYYNIKVIEKNQVPLPYKKTTWSTSFVNLAILHLMRYHENNNFRFGAMARH